MGANRLSGVTARSRVCIVSEGFYPPAIGGQQKYIHDLGVALVRKGLPVLVITRQPDPPALPMEWVDGIRVIRLPPGGLLTGKGWWALMPLLRFIAGMLLALIRERRTYDVILVSGMKVLPFPALLVGALFDKRCIIRSESPIELWQPISDKSLKAMRLLPSAGLIRVLRAIRLRLAWRADRVIAISTQMADQLVHAGFPAERIECIDYSIDTVDFSPIPQDEKAQLRLQLGLPANKIIFVYTGRLTTSKGIPILLKAWQQACGQHTDTHLLLVGTGAGCFDDCEAESRQHVANHALEGGVTFAGAVNSVRDHLRAADAFIFPSLYEGFGLSIAEALACGLPSIVSRVGVACDVLVDRYNGLTVRPGDASELEDAIHWMLVHRESWAEMGARARKDVADRYGMQRVADRYASLFEMVCAAAKDPHRS